MSGFCPIFQVAPSKESLLLTNAALKRVCSCLDFTIVAWDITGAISQGVLNED